MAFERADALGAGTEAAFGRARVLVAQEKYAEAVTLLDPPGAAVSPSVHLSHAWLCLAGARPGGRGTHGRGTGSVCGPAFLEGPARCRKGSIRRRHRPFLLCQNLLGAGKVDEALAILETLRGEQPDETCGETGHAATRTCEILNALSLAYVRAGRVDEAFALVQRGLAINPDFFPFHLNVADRYRGRRELDSALRHIDRAIALNPSLGYGYEQRGRLLIGLGRIDEAMMALETAVRLAPERPVTLLYLGMVEGERERWPQAIEYLERAVRLDPQFAVGHAYLARGP